MNFLYEECEIDKIIIFSLNDKNINVKNSGIKLLTFICQQFLISNSIVLHQFGMVFPVVETKNNSLVNDEIRRKTFV